MGTVRFNEEDDQAAASEEEITSVCLPVGGVRRICCWIIRWIVGWTGVKVSGVTAGMEIRQKEHDEEPGLGNSAKGIASTKNTKRQLGDEDDDDDDDNVSVNDHVLYVLAASALEDALQRVPPGCVAVITLTLEKIGDRQNVRRFAWPLGCLA